MNRRFAHVGRRCPAFPRAFSPVFPLRKGSQPLVQVGRYITYIMSFVHHEGDVTDGGTEEKGCTNFAPNRIRTWDHLVMVI